jgi:Ca-activated chloride channel homolog
MASGSASRSSSAPAPVPSLVMSFQSPLLLLALLLVPCGVLAYVAHARRASRAVGAFAPTPVLPSLTPRRPGWRRHAPYALYVVAPAGLLRAVARPEITVAVPDERASIVLVTDTSGSMEATDVPPSRLSAAREAGLEFLDDVPDEVRVGLVVFNHRIRTMEPASRNRAAVREVLERVQARGGTATGDALAGALGLVEGRGSRGAPAAIVLLSDGASTHGRQPLPLADAAARRRIPIYTVALGTDAGTIQVETPSGTVARAVPPDRDTLRRLAASSGGRYFEAGDRLELSEVYERLGSQVGKRDEQRDVTAAFAGGGALLILAGGALSLLWFRRLP